LVQDKGDTTRHASRKITPGASEHDHDTARNIFAAKLPDPFGHRELPRIVHGETLAGHAPEIALALDRAVQHRLGNDKPCRRHDCGIGRWSDNQPPIWETFTDIVGRVTIKLESNTARQPRAESLAGRTVEANVNGVIRQTFMVIAFCHFAGEHATASAVRI